MGDSAAPRSTVEQTNASLVPEHPPCMSEKTLVHIVRRNRKTDTVDMGIQPIRHGPYLSQITEPAGYGAHTAGNPQSKE